MDLHWASLRSVDLGKPCLSIASFMWRTVVAGLLGVIAGTKVLAILSPTPLMAQKDAILGMSIFQVVVIACVLEILLLILVCLSKRRTVAAGGVFAFAAVVLSYRIIAHTYGVSRCPCLGNVADWWPWLGQHEGPILTTISLWLFLTSAMQLISASPGLGSERIQVCER